MFIMLLVIVSFAETMTFYTEGRYYITIDSDGELNTTGATLEDRSKWEFDTDSECFIHSSNTGTVRQSTYWFETDDIEYEDEGITLVATSDAGNTRRFYFLVESVLIILNSYSDGSKDIVSFEVKNIVTK